MALKRVWIGSPNYYSGNSGRRLLVVHSSEGAQSYQDLGNFFANASSQVSSHVGIDDKVRGTIGEYVKRGNSAWTAGNANGVSIQVELCTPSGASANWSRQTWLNHETMLRNLADWLREESQQTGIPLNELTSGQAQGSGRGVCQHTDLGSWGGGHSDCGPNFPMDQVLKWAKGQDSGGTGYNYREDDPEMFYLQFVNGKAPIVIPSQHTDGKSRIRFGANEACQIRIDWSESGGRGNTDLDLGYDSEAQGTDIKDGDNYAVIRRLDESECLVACTYSR